jgi:hypothetical protein
MQPQLNDENLDKVDRLKRWAEERDHSVGELDRRPALRPPGSSPPPSATGEPAWWRWYSRARDADDEIVMTSGGWPVYGSGARRRVTTGVHQRPTKGQWLRPCLVLEPMADTMRDYCTYFDHRYLVRGLALYRSLAATGTPFRLWVLCLDAPCLALLRRLDLPHLRLLPLAALERADPALAGARRGRTLVEYYFTCTPALLLHLFRTRADVDLLTYLDADLFFFADPAPLFAALGDRSVAIVPHRYPPRLAHLAAAFGEYNVGWLSFRRDAPALACLTSWRRQCLAWCYDRVEAGRYADQKYLDAWPARFPGVVVLRHPGANLAPWNLATHRLAAPGGRVAVDGAPLLFFHFHRLRAIRPWLFAPRLSDFGVTMDAVMRRHLYGPYLRELRLVHHALRSLAPQLAVLGSLRGRFTPGPSTPTPHRVAGSAWPAGARLLEIVRRIFVGEYVVVPYRPLRAFSPSLLALPGAGARVDRDHVDRDRVDRDEPGRLVPAAPAGAMRRLLERES